jgi:hypothetical protein
MADPPMTGLQPCCCSRERRRLIVASSLAISLVLTTGCTTEQSNTPKPTVIDYSQSPFRANASDSPADTSGVPPMRRLFIEFAVLRVETARPHFSDNPRLWEFVDEGAVPAAVRMALRDSGFRVGVGQEAARDPLTRWLEEQPEVQSKLERTIPNQDELMEIVLTYEGRDYVVFYVRTTGPLAGQHFEQAWPVLNIAFEVITGDFENVRLRVFPEMRERPGPLRYERVGADYLLRPTPQQRLYHELAFDVTVPRGGFLLLGPDADVYRLPLLGRAFFTEGPADRMENASENDAKKTPDATQRESIYVISPIFRWAGLGEQVSR